jgi:hypothetical protein
MQCRRRKVASNVTRALDQLLNQWPPPTEELGLAGSAGKHRSARARKLEGHSTFRVILPLPICARGRADKLDQLITFAASGLSSMTPPDGLTGLRLRLVAKRVE